MLSLVLSKLIETKLQPLASISCKAFLKNKRGLVFSGPHFCMIFEEKYFSCSIVLTDQISLSGCLYFVRY